MKNYQFCFIMCVLFAILGKVSDSYNAVFICAAFCAIFLIVGFLELINFPECLRK